MIDLDEATFEGHERHAVRSVVEGEAKSLLRLEKGAQRRDALGRVTHGRDAERLGRGADRIEADFDRELGAVLPAADPVRLAFTNGDIGDQHLERAADDLLGG